MNINGTLKAHGIGGGINTSDATITASDVLVGKIAYGSTDKITGTMPNNGATTLTPSGSNSVAIPAGYHNGTGIVSQVIVPSANVKSGTTIAGVAGTMPNIGSITLTPSGTGNVTIPAGYHDGTGVVSQVVVPSANVKSGTTIAGVAGTMPDNGAVTITPGSTSKSINAGYHNGAGIVSGDANLIAAKIKNGETIFGITGSYNGDVPVSGTQTYSSPGTYTFTVPAGVYRLFARIWGAGGGGSSGGGSGSSLTGAGGGGGAYALARLDVTPGENISVTVGTGGSGGSAGSGGTQNSGVAGSNSVVRNLIAGGGQRGVGSTGGSGGLVSGTDSLNVLILGTRGETSGNSTNANPYWGTAGGKNYGATGGNNPPIYSGSYLDGANNGGVTGKSDASPPAQTAGNGSLGAGGGGGAGNTSTYSAGGSGGNGKVILAW